MTMEVIRVSRKCGMWAMLQINYRLKIYTFSVFVMIFAVIGGLNQLAWNDDALTFAPSSDSSYAYDADDETLEDVNPEIVSVFPNMKASSVHLISDIRVTFNCSLSEGSISVSGVPGETHVADNTLIFYQKALYRPNTEHSVTVTAVSKQGFGIVPYTFMFSTLNLEGSIWVEVDLARTHKVCVYRGDMPIKIMLASAGAEDTPTPLGTFYISDRGMSFFAPRFGEGALYWVRFYKTYLFHSMPRDPTWIIKEDAVNRLGKPASHGCVRFLDEDAEWFFRNVPRGTMVIIHEFSR
jgi:lipoprotein-anchoring transpeptidase ErfK/SrfK